MKKYSSLILNICFLSLLMACSKDDVPTTSGTTGGGTTTPTKSSAKDITKFSFSALSPAVDATIDATAKTISATVPAATDLTKLVPTITISDKATVSPATGVAQDFSKEVSYTVTAEDASTVVYKVIVKKEEAYIQNDMVFYSGGDDKKIYALDAESGTKKWEFLATETGEIASLPVYESGVLYFGTSATQFGTLSPGKLYALDAKTGTKKWEFPLDVLGLSIRSAIMISNGILYFGTGGITSKENNYFYSIEASTGKLVWKSAISPKTPYESSIHSSTVANGLVYFSSYNRNLYALDIKTGAIKWEYDYGFSNFGGSSNAIAVTNGVVYLGYLSFLALDAQSGSKKWEYKGAFATGNEYDSFSACAPTISNGILFIGNNSTNTSTKGKIVALNPVDGSKKWEYIFDNSSVANFSADKSYLYATSGGSSNHKLIAFDLVTGVKKWEYTDVEGYFSPPTPANGIIYISSKGKKIYAIDAKTGIKKWENTHPSNTALVPTCIVADKNGNGFHPAVSGMVQ